RGLIEREALGPEEVNAAIERRPLPERPGPTPPQQYKPDSAEPDEGAKGKKASKDEPVGFPVAEPT
ncbi:MAG: hypothetical protein KDK70_38305, partial [Myxococcales bacterium]|nr:hypothetical protein [Myxococcales bacterium]